MIDNALMVDVAGITGLDVPNRHTFFQLNFFVLGKEPTHQAKLRRCVEELKSRKQQIEGLAMQIDDLHDQNEMIYLEMDSGSFLNAKDREIKCRMAERRIRQNNKSIDDLTDKTKNTEEEMVFFVRAFHKLNELEPMKEWDSIEVQAEYWNAKIAEEVSYRVLMQMPIDMEIIKTALALPDDTPIRRQVSAILKKQGDKLTAMEKKDSITVVA